LEFNLSEIFKIYTPKEGTEGVKWDWDLPVFLTGKWDLLYWDWDFCHWEWETEHEMGMGFDAKML